MPVPVAAYRPRSPTNRAHWPLHSFLEGRSTMSDAITRIAAATVVTVVAGLGLTGSAGSATAATGGPCQGQSAPANTNIANQAPVANDDTVSMVAGTLRTIKVLAND